MRWGIAMSSDRLDIEQVDKIRFAYEDDEGFYNDAVIAYLFLSLWISLAGDLDPDGLLQALPTMSEEALRRLQPWCDLNDEEEGEGYHDRKFLHRPESLSTALRTLAQVFEEQQPGAKVLWHHMQSNDGFWETVGSWLGISKGNDTLAVADCSAHIALELRRLAHCVELVGQSGEQLIRLELHT